MTFTGYAPNGLPYARLDGSGPPLVILTGSELQHRPPTRSVVLGYRLMLRRLCRQYTVYLCSRRSGLAHGTTARDLSEDFAAMIRSEISGPVHLVGLSSGGSSAMHLAADHPELVQRLVLAMTGHRMNAHGAEVARVWRDLALGGDWPALWARMGTDVAEGRSPEWLVQWMMRRFGRALLGVPSDNGRDLAAVLDADLGLDVGSALPRITAPTLVIGGTDDPFYGEHIRATAQLIAGAQLCLIPGGHAVVKSSPRAFETALLGFLGHEAPQVHANHPAPLP